MPVHRPDTTIIPVYGKTPRVHDSAFIAPGCRIMGDVEIGPDVSIWYNCVIRGDVNRVHIGARTNIQDGTVVHCDSGDAVHPGGFPTLIGEDVLIGHMAMIHGTVLEDRAFVGLGAIVMDGCRIGSGAMLAAGAQLTPNKHIPSGQLWTGRPARYARDLTEEALAGMRAGVAGYVENGRVHRAAVDAALAGFGSSGAAKA